MIKQKFQKAMRKIKPFINILLYIFIIALIRGESPFGKLGGWTLLGVLLVINLYTLWKSREFLKQTKQYIWMVAKEKAEESKKK